MFSGLDWLALEVKYLDRAKRFYADHLRLPVLRETEREVVFGTGDSEFILRRPSGVPRGGVHTHFAFSTPAAEYDDWYARLSEDFELVEHDFGSAKSLYFDDPDGHCVEIGQSRADGTGIVGIFEVVLEVEDLNRAEAFYTALGMEPFDRGETRQRVRLDAGPVHVELWEPQLGIADARGGLHVDLGFETDDPETLVERVEERACAVDQVEDGIRIRDENGHYLTFRT